MSRSDPQKWINSTWASAKQWGSDAGSWLESQFQGKRNKRSEIQSWSKRKQYPKGIVVIVSESCPHCVSVFQDLEVLNRMVQAKYPEYKVTVYPSDAAPQTGKPTVPQFYLVSKDGDPVDYEPAKRKADVMFGDLENMLSKDVGRGYYADEVSEWLRKFDTLRDSDSEESEAEEYGKSAPYWGKQGKSDDYRKSEPYWGKLDKAKDGDMGKMVRWNPDLQRKLDAAGHRDSTAKLAPLVGSELERTLFNALNLTFGEDGRGRLRQTRLYTERELAEILLLLSELRLISTLKEDREDATDDISRKVEGHSTILTKILDEASSCRILDGP